MLVITLWKKNIFYFKTYNRLIVLVLQAIRPFCLTLGFFFVFQVNYGRDFEQQLNFYVEARATFSSLDSVLIMLVQVLEINPSIIKSYLGLSVYIYILLSKW